MMILLLFGGNTGKWKCLCQGYLRDHKRVQAFNYLASVSSVSVSEDVSSREEVGAKTIFTTSVTFGSGGKDIKNSCTTTLLKGLTNGTM